MRKITEIYDEYKILNNLREHQMRVAGICMMICDSIDFPVDREDILKACVIHDMGNIIKADLNYYPQFLEPEGYEYWKKVQDDFKGKYGDNEHEATLKIIKEIGVTDKIFDIISFIGYPYVEIVVGSDDFNKKIVAYADFRVALHGIMSIDGRAEEGRKRYIGRKNDATQEERERKHVCIKELENQIFVHLNIKPEDINDDSVAPYIEKVKNFEL